MHTAAVCGTILLLGAESSYSTPVDAVTGDQISAQQYAECLVTLMSLE